MADEEARRHHYDMAQIEADKKALREQNLKLARELAEKDKHFVPTEEQRRTNERLDKAYEERKKRPVEPPRQPAKYDFAPGVAPDGSLYPVHDRKPPAPPPPPAAEDHEWDGVTLRTGYTPEEAGRRDQIADAARKGLWPQLLALLDTGRVNRTRPGGTEGFAPLHQVAWHGAPVEVAQRLVELGAWRLLRTASGHTPLAIARQRGHQHLAGVLEPVVRHPLADDVLRGLEEHLTMLIRGGRYADFVLRQQLRLPQLAPITELTVPKLWFPVPGQYGGIEIELQGTELMVTNSSRAGGWSLRYRVTPSSVEFVEERIDAPGVPPIVRSPEPGR